MVTDDVMDRAPAYYRFAQFDLWPLEIVKILGFTPAKTCQIGCRCPIAQTTCLNLRHARLARVEALLGVTLSSLYNSWRNPS